MRYRTQGTCCKAIDVEVVDGKVESVVFHGGCNGNTKGLSSLVKGMDAQDVIQRLESIICGPRTTSCPDQLAQALKEALK